MQIEHKSDFLSIIEEHRGIINSLCKVYYNRKEDQKDAQQDIILQLWKAWPSFRGEAKVSTWMYRICLNVLLAKKRKENRRIEEADLETTDLKETQEFPTEEDVRLLLEIVELLNDEEKEIITHYLEGYKNKEISKILMISQTNVSTRLHRIKRKLKRRYETLMVA